MAYTSGTATSHYDLLIRLRTWLIGQGWTSLAFTDDSGATTTGFGTVVNLQAPGLGASQRLFLNIRTVNASGLTQYGLEIRTAQSFSSSLAFGSNAGECPPTYLNLWNSTIGYWFFANDRRVVIVAKTSTVYVSAYAGFFLPWANPSQYSWPQFVGGDYNVPATWSTVNSGRRMFVDAASGNAYVKTSANVWVPVNNSIVGNSNDSADVSSVGNWAKVWPYHPGSYSANADPKLNWPSTNLGGSSGGALDQFIPTRQGERFVWPCMLINGNGSQFGALEGVYALPGAGIATEATVTAGARTFLAFQNIARTSGNDFFAVEQI